MVISLPCDFSFTLRDIPEAFILAEDSIDCVVTVELLPGVVVEQLPESGAIRLFDPLVPEMVSHIQLAFVKQSVCDASILCLVFLIKKCKQHVPAP